MLFIVPVSKLCEDFLSSLSVFKCSSMEGCSWLLCLLEFVKGLVDKNLFAVSEFIFVVFVRSDVVSRLMLFFERLFDPRFFDRRLLDRRFFDSIFFVSILLDIFTLRFML